MFNNDEYIKFLEEWEDNRKYTKFCYDGLINVKNWESSSKIMFLLKESYGTFDTIHEEGSLGYNSDGSPQFWRNMRMYTYIADEMMKGNTPKWEEAFKIKDEPNDSVAYVNIKKSVENNTESNDNIINEYAEKDREYLLRQIKLISPKIIFCTGTFQYCDIIFGKENIKTIAHNISLYNDNILLVGYYHLSYFGVGFEEAFNAVVKIMSHHFNK